MVTLFVQCDDAVRAALGTPAIPATEVNQFNAPRRSRGSVVVIGVRAEWGEAGATLVLPCCRRFAALGGLWWLPRPVLFGREDGRRVRGPGVGERGQRDVGWGRVRGGKDIVDRLRFVDRDGEVGLGGERRSLLWNPRIYSCCFRPE